MDAQVVTIDEFAKIFSISRRTVYRMIQENEVHVIKIHGSVRITLEEVERLKGSK